MTFNLKEILFETPIEYMIGDKLKHRTEYLDSKLETIKKFNPFYEENQSDIDAIYEVVDLKYSHLKLKQSNNSLFTIVHIDECNTMFERIN